MLNLRVYWIVILFIVCTGFSHADDILPSLNVNGCGTEGIQGVLIPDSTLFTRCQFMSSCNKHDLCYGKCLKGGELFGKELCHDPIAKEARRMHAMQISSTILLRATTTVLYANSMERYID